MPLVAEEDGRLPGYIMLSEAVIRTEGGEVGGPRPGPVGVILERQVRGAGSALVWGALNRCARAGHSIVVLLGHPNYYPRCRFSAGRARGLSSALSGEAFMTLELAPGALPRVAGEFEFAPPFGAVS